MNRNLILYMIISICMVEQACTGNNQQGHQRNATDPIPITTIEVQPRNRSLQKSYPGTIVALNETELYSEVKGYITDIHVKNGTYVARDQPLYQLDRIRFKAVQDRAKADLTIAEANLLKVQNDVERYTRLMEQEAIATQTYDHTLTELSTARAQVLSARAGLAKATIDFERSTIRAPFNGLIGMSKVQKGTLVSVGGTLINTISSVNPIAIDFTVNAEEIDLFSQLKNKEQSANDSTVLLRLSPNEIHRFTGKIIAIDRAVDPGTNTIRIRAAFENPDQHLRAGMNANILIAYSSKSVPFVPQHAVIEQLGEFTVFVVTDSGTVSQTPVRLGSKIGELVMVNEGLNVGDKIAVDGIQSLREGVKVIERTN